MSTLDANKANNDAASEPDNAVLHSQFNLASPKAKTTQTVKNADADERLKYILNSMKR